MKRFKSAIALLAALCLGGCQWFLPPGDPPDGPITHNHPEEHFPPAEAENRLITLLVTWMLTHPEHREFRLEAEPGSLARLQRIFAAAAVTGGGRLVPEAKAVISADFSAPEWKCEISDGGSLQETLRIAVDGSKP